MTDNCQTDPDSVVLFIGIDWGDQKHDCYCIDRDGRARAEQIEHSPEAIEAWVTEKLVQSGGKPIAIILEQSRGALIHALMGREKLRLYPINPKQLAHYRESYSNAGCKSDAPDARLLARMLYERHQILKSWEPDDEATRLLGRLCETRRKVVNERTRLHQQLIDLLKAENSPLLGLGGEKKVTPLLLLLVKRWPDPRHLKRADRKWLHHTLKEHGYRNEEQREELIQRLRSAKLICTDRAVLEPTAVLIRSLAHQCEVLQDTINKLEELIEEEMNKHPDAAIFKALPGAGKALAPRLLTAFGSQRDRYARAEEIAAFSGIAPVTKQSGKSRIVHRRFACPKYLRQTFHEFADHARKWCPWSRAYYAWQRSRGMKHHATLRKLAFCWIRIIYKIWKTRTPYDAGKYIESLKTKNPDILPFLKLSTADQ